MGRNLVVVLALCLATGACKREASSAGAAAGAKGGAGGGRRGAAAFPVEASPVESRRVEYSVDAVGSVAAFEEVQVTARVAGAVERVRFTEGETVKPGAVLVEIEPARYKLAVDAARALQAKAQAAQADAQAGVDRREKAIAQNPGLIPGEEVATWQTRVRTAGAEAAQAKVALDQAELNLRDAYVRAGAGGVIQTRTVQTGQYVQPGTVLATLVNREPLLLRFEVPEPDAARLHAGMEARFTVRGQSSDSAGGAAGDFRARITYVAARATETSRMVPVTAQVDDPRKDTLRPGAFAEVKVPIGAVENALVVPQTAVRPSERGFLAYVIEGGGGVDAAAGGTVARERVLELGMRTADGRVEVKHGLAAGERLVVRGAEALRDGAKVKVTGR